MLFKPITSRNIQGKHLLFVHKLIINAVFFGKL